MKRRLAWLAVAAVAAVSGSAAAVAPGASTPVPLPSPVSSVIDTVTDLIAPPSVEGETAAQVEARLLADTNAERVARGLRPLRIDGALLAAARRHSARMAAGDDIWHNDPGLLHEIAGWYALGENVGRGPTSRDLHDAFMASPEHRVNILDRGFTLVGIGAVVRADGTIFVTEDFEQPEGTAAPAPATVPAPPPVIAAPQTVVDVLVRLLDLDH